MDLFYVTDERDELPAEARVAEISRAVQRVGGRGGGGTARVVLTPAPAFVSARRSDAARLFEQGSIGRIETASATQYTEATVTVDNLMSEKHTVFQIRTRDRKGLLYDVLRASKDLEVKVNYAKVEMRDGDGRRGRGGDRNVGSSRETRLGVDDDDHGHGAGGHLCEIDLFVGRCTDVRERRYLCQRYKENVERPVSVQIMTAGLDETTTELRVIAPLDISGFTRPRVLLDVTEALRQLQVMVFKADILIDDPEPAPGRERDSSSAVAGGGRARTRCIDFWSRTSEGNPLDARARRCTVFCSPTPARTTHLERARSARGVQPSRGVLLRVEETFFVLPHGSENFGEPKTCVSFASCDAPLGVVRTTDGARRACRPPPPLTSSRRRWNRAPPTGEPRTRRCRRARRRRRGGGRAPDPHGDISCGSSTNRVAGRRARLPATSRTPTHRQKPPFGAGRRSPRSSWWAARAAASPPCSSPSSVATFSRAVREYARVGRSSFSCTAKSATPATPRASCTPRRGVRRLRGCARGD